MQVVSPFPVLNLSGNLPDLLYQSVPNEVVTVKLFKGADLIIEELYRPDAASQIRIRYKNIIEKQLRATIPTFNQALVDQASAYADFKVTASSSLGFNDEQFFRVIKGEVSTDLLDTDIFLQTNFLTWQPQLKYVKYHDPEWLSYYAVETAILKVTACTFPGQVVTTKTLAVLPSGQLSTVNVNYGNILNLFSAEGIPLYYDVFVERSLNRLTYVQRYIFSQVPDLFDDLFVFENSLGGIDTIRFTGEAVNKQNYIFNKALFDEVILDYNFEPDIAIEKNTGFFGSVSERLWSLDFFSSLLKYKNDQGNLVRIYTEDPDLESIKGELSAYTFTYFYSNKTEAMNLCREYEAPPLLQLDTDVDGEFFHMSPRINHYPYATTSDVIIPVQYPYEDKWRKLSLTDLLRGVITPGEGGNDTTINLLSGNFGAWETLPSLSEDVEIEEVAIQFKADLVSFPTRAIVYLTGQFRLSEDFEATTLALGLLPGYARPVSDIKKYFITQNIEMFLEVLTTGEVNITSKDGYELPVDPDGHAYFIDLFFNPDIVIVPPAFTYPRTQMFQRLNCNDGYTGSMVEFTKNYSAATMAEAEQLAAADANYESEGAAFANDPANGGVCVLDPVEIVYTSTRTQNFSMQCQPGYVGTSVSFSKDYTSVVSQADADNKAAEDSANFNILGQAFANDPANGGACEFQPYYIWGKITYENPKTINTPVGIFVDVMLRTYKGTSPTIPPAAVPENLINCNHPGIPLQVVGSSNSTIDYTAAMNGTNTIRLVPGSPSNPFYPKQPTKFGPNTFKYVFSGEGENVMTIIQTIN